MNISPQARSMSAGSPTATASGSTFLTYSWPNAVTDAASLDVLYKALTEGKTPVNFDTDTIPINLKANSSISLADSDIVKYAKLLTQVKSAFTIKLVGDIDLSNLKLTPDALIPKIILPTGKPPVTASGTVADFTAAMTKLQTLGTKVLAVTLSDKANSAISLTAAALAANSTTLKKISGSYTLNVTNVAAANAASTASTILQDTKKTSNGTVESLSVSDTSANISSKIDALQALNTSKPAVLTSISSSDGKLINVTKAQLTSDADAIGKLASGQKLNVTSLALADVDATLQNSRVGGVSVNLAVADLTSSNLDKLKSLVAAGQLTGVTLSDKTAQTLNLSADDFGKYAQVLGSVTNMATLKIALTSNSLSAQNMVGVTAALAAKLSTTTNLAVTGAGADFVNNIGSLSALSTAGKIGSVTLSDVSEMTFSSSVYKTNAAAIALLKGPQKTVTFSGAKSSYQTTVNANGSLTVLDKRTGSPDGSVTLTAVNYAKFTDMAVFATSGDSNIDALLNLGTNAWWYDGQGASSSSSLVSPSINALSTGSSKHELKYSFLTELPTSATVSDKKGFLAMTDTQKIAVKAALDYISSLVNITFTMVKSSEVANISFGTNNQGSTSAGYANPPQGNGANPTSYLFLNNVAATNTKTDSFTPGNYGWETLVHEIGHTMGLKHPGNYKAGGGSTPGPYLPAATDNRRMSLMSYTNPTDGFKITATSASASRYSWSPSAVNPTTFGVYDVAALQYLYGANTNTTTSTPLLLTDSYQSIQTVWAPKGVAIDASATTHGNVFDLRGGAYSSVAVRGEADGIADLTAQLKASGMTPQAAAVGAKSIWAAKSDVANAKGTFVSTLNSSLYYTGKNDVGLAYGSTISSVKGGSGKDVFYAANYESALDGGGGTDDIVYLQGSEAQWQYEGGSALAGGSLSGSDVTLINKISNIKLTLKGVENYQFYNASDSMLHTA